VSLPSPDHQNVRLTTKHYQVSRSVRRSSPALNPELLSRPPIFFYSRLLVLGAMSKTSLVYVHIFGYGTGLPPKLFSISLTVTIATRENDQPRRVLQGFPLAIYGITEFYPVAYHLRATKLFSAF
jgi:hypothetical protein